MIRKSVERFSGKIMLKKQRAAAGREPLPRFGHFRHGLSRAAYLGGAG
jgi:hypothetical protein